MSSHFNCSYMARSSLAYVRGFCLKFFFQPIYTDYANLAYFDKRSHLNFSSETTEPNETKPDRDGPWVGPSQNCVRLQFWSKFDYPSWSYCPFFINLFFNFNTFRLILQNYLEIDVKFKLQKCAAYQDLPTLQFLSKSHYPFWPIMQIRKKGGWN
jgi:hypothetical protein